MSHHHHHNNTKNIKIAFILNLCFTILEFIGGIYVNSVAIVSDAVHDLGDSLSLGTSWYLQTLSNKKPNQLFNFGYRRFSLLAALLNSVVLLLGSFWVVKEAIERILNPELSNAEGMFVFSLIGIGVNGYAAWKVSKGKSLNEKVISWHFIEDVLGWAAILCSSIYLYFDPNPYIDPILSILLSLYILWNVLKRFKETVYLFLQTVPKGLKVDSIIDNIKALMFVASVHHVKIWSLDGEHHVFTCHVKLTKSISNDEIILLKTNIKKILDEAHFQFSTIEFEYHDEHCEFNADDKLN